MSSQCIILPTINHVHDSHAADSLFLDLVACMRCTDLSIFFFSYFSLLGLLLSQKGLSYGSKTVHGLLIHKNIKHIFKAQCFFLDFATK